MNFVKLHYNLDKPGANYSLFSAALNEHFQVNITLQFTLIPPCVMCPVFSHS